MSDTKKYYWLKLQRDFFKRHDIQIIESMPNGEKYLIFYLKLLCESVDHDGNLRFSEEIPYEEEMLATITHMNIDIVKSAVKLFTNLKMMEIMDDGTYYMNQIEKMTGSATSDSIRMKLAREKNTISIQSNDKANNVQKCSEIVHQSIELRDKSKELDNIKSVPNVTKQTFSKPKLDEVKEYCQERNNSVDAEKFIDHYESVGWKVGRNPMKSWQAAVRTWEKSDFTKNKPTSEIDYSRYKDWRL